MNYRNILFATCLGVASLGSANALEFDQYIGARLTYSDISADHVMKGVDKHDHTTEIDTFTDKWSFDDNAFGGSLVYGLDFGVIRTELEANLLSNVDKTYDGIKTELKHRSVFLNAYYDFENKTRFTPYVGAGIGVAFLKAERSFDTEKDGYMSDSDTKANFAWQLGAGVSFEATDNLTFDLGYRYVDNGDVKLSNFAPREGDTFNDKIESNANEFYLGMRYSF